MNGMAKAWLAIITIFACAVVAIRSIDSMFVSTALAIVAVPVCAMIGERLFRFFNNQDRPHADNE